MPGFYSRNKREEKGQVQHSVSSKEQDTHPALVYGVMSYMEREWLDEALLIGMTAEEFWYGDPELYYNYARVYELKQKAEQQNLWQIGARVKQALNSSIVSTSMADKSTLRNLPEYPPCPFTEEADKETMDENEIEIQRLRAKVWLENWVNSFKKK